MSTYHPNTTSHASHAGLPIQTASASGYRIDILDRLCRLFFHTRDCFERTRVFRLDLKFPQHGDFADDNRHLVRFIDSFSNYLICQGLRHVHLWVREHEHGEHHHYHTAFFVDGIPKWHEEQHEDKARELWALAAGRPEAAMMVHVSQDNGIDTLQSKRGMIHWNEPGSDQRFRDLFYWISYCAKADTKGNAPPGVREFGSSRV